MKELNKNILNINSNRLIDDMYELEDRYHKQYGCSPYNLSLWDPSEEFQSQILEILNLPYYPEIMRYKFSDEVDEKYQVLMKLGYSIDESECLITPTGSISILCALNWLQHKGIKNLYVICPSYYTILYHCQKVGIKANKIYLKRTENDFILREKDRKSLISANAIWINNPIYCTGRSFNKGIIGCLKKVLENGGYIVSDECMSLSGDELGRALGQYPGFIGIHSPHKTISINSTKFSVVVFHENNLSFYENWGDILYGCLLSSNIIALKHFLSSNFNILQKATILYNSLTFNYIKDIVANTDNCFTDKHIKGNLISIYTPKISSNQGNNKTFLWKLFKNTGASFIPGNRYLFDPEGSFCFRINLSRDNLEFRSSFVRLINFLSTLIC